MLLAMLIPQARSVAVTIGEDDILFLMLKFGLLRNIWSKILTIEFNVQKNNL